MQRALASSGTRALRRANAYSNPRCVLGRRHASINPFNWVSQKFQSRFLEPRSDHVSEKAKAEKKKKALEAKRAARPEELSVFDAATEDASEVDSAESEKRVQRVNPRESHKYSTMNFKISARKLNMLGRQIAGKPIDHAILQMQFSEKRASERIKNMLVTAKDHASRYRALETSKLVIAESWVSKGTHKIRRIEPKGRGRTGIQTHPLARLHVVLKEGKTLEEQKQKLLAKRLRKIQSAGFVREDKPIRNPGANWAW